MRFGSELSGFELERPDGRFLVLTNSVGEVVSISPPFVGAVVALLNRLDAVRVQHPVDHFGADLFVVALRDGRCAVVYRYRTSPAYSVLTLDEHTAPALLMLAIDHDQLPRVEERGEFPGQAVEVTFSGPVDYVLSAHEDGVRIEGANAGRYHPPTACPASINLTRGAP